MSDIDAFIQFLIHQRRYADYVYVSSAALLIYDYFLTLRLEIKLIWLAKWSYTKVLFLLIRFLAFATIITGIWSQTPVDVPLGACAVINPLFEWTATLIILLSEAVLSLRTWAVWGRNKVIGIGLGLMTVAHLILQCYVANRVSRSFQFGTPPYQGFRGCFFVQGDTIVSVNFAAAAGVEAVVLILMGISAFRLYRIGSNSEFVHVIHRDGILFYVYLLVLNAMNLAFVYGMPTDLMVALSPLEATFYPLLTCRIILKIRGADSYGTHESELHTTFIHDFPTGHALRFRSADSGDFRNYSPSNDEEDH